MLVNWKTGLETGELPLHVALSCYFFGFGNVMFGWVLLAEKTPPTTVKSRSVPTTATYFLSNVKTYESKPK